MSVSPPLVVTWTWARIRHDWPGVTDLAYEPDVIVDAFNRRHERLGPPVSATVEPQTGTYAPLSIICDGRRLSALDGVVRADRLVTRLRHDPGAWAELEGLFILRSGSEQTEAEIDPAVSVNGRTRLADSRVRRSGDTTWTYVEVSRPGETLARVRVSEYLKPYANKLGPGETRAVSLYLRRRPSSDELDELREFLAGARVDSDSLSIDLPDELGPLVVRAERSEAPHGMAVIKWVVPDARGANFLRQKAPQLPADSPTIVMLDVSEALVDWSQSLQAHLAEGKHRWISAVYLFTSGFAPSPQGEAWAISARLVENPDPIVSLPTWVRDALRRYVPTEIDSG